MPVLPPLAAQALEGFCASLRNALDGAPVSIYLCGSLALEDYRPGWSDIDVLCLTSSDVPEQAADALLFLRQRLVEATGQPIYRTIEGAVLPVFSLQSHFPTRVVYWGTSGERLDTVYDFNAFSMLGFLTQGQLLSGAEVRSAFQPPIAAQLRGNARQVAETAIHVSAFPNHSLYGYGWLLDISRCLYTLQTGRIISKTAAGEWALERGCCPDPDCLRLALQARYHPETFQSAAVLERDAPALSQAQRRYAQTLLQTINTLEGDVP